MWRWFHVTDATVGTTTAVFGIRSESKVLGMSIMTSVIAKLLPSLFYSCEPDTFPVFGHSHQHRKVSVSQDYHCSSFIASHSTQIHFLYFLRLWCLDNSLKKNLNGSIKIWEFMCLNSDHLITCKWRHRAWPPKHNKGLFWRFVTW